MSPDSDKGCYFAVIDTQDFSCDCSLLGSFICISKTTTCVSIYYHTEIEQTSNKKGKPRTRGGTAGWLYHIRYNVINSWDHALFPTWLALRPRSCIPASSHFYSATWAMDGRECHALIPYLRHRDLSGPPQFLEGCAQPGRDTPGWSLFSAKSLLHCQSNLIIRSSTESK